MCTCVSINYWITSVAGAFKAITTETKCDWYELNVTHTWVTVGDRDSFKNSFKLKLQCGYSYHAQAILFDYSFFLYKQHLSFFPFFWSFHFIQNQHLNESFWLSLNSYFWSLLNEHIHNVRGFFCLVVYTPPLQVYAQFTISTFREMKILFTLNQTTTAIVFNFFNLAYFLFFFSLVSH